MTGEESADNNLKYGDRWFPQLPCGRRAPALAWEGRATSSPILRGKTRGLAPAHTRTGLDTCGALLNPTSSRCLPFHAHPAWCLQRARFEDFGGDIVRQWENTHLRLRVLAARTILRALVPCGSPARLHAYSSVLAHLPKGSCYTFIRLVHRYYRMQLLLAADLPAIPFHMPLWPFYLFSARQPPWHFCRTDSSCLCLASYRRQYRICCKARAMAPCAIAHPA